MMKAFRIVLEILGILFLIGIVALGGMYFYGFNDNEKINRANENQVKFVLNWGGLNVKQNYSVISSYEQQNSFLRDHLIYYCLQLSEFGVDSNHQKDWNAGPEANPVFSDVIELAANSGKSNECFTQHAQPNSKEVQVLFWAVRTHGRFPTGAQVLLYETSSRRLLYVDYET